MTAAFALGDFLARWGKQARHDLSASESATLSLAALLEMARPDDERRWRNLGLGYADPHGAAWLRDTIAARHPMMSPDAILCCAGAQEGLACVARALLSPGDHAVIVMPIYQPSERAVTSICAASGVPLSFDRTWHLDVGRVAAAIQPRTRLLLMNFPNSPTGAVLDPATLAALVALCRHHGLWLVSDEVYRGTDGAPAPMPAVDAYERGITVDAVSKRLGLPGLRVGWVACRDGAVRAGILAAKSALSSCLAAPSEVLAHIALQAEPRILTRNAAIAGRNRGALRRVAERHPDVFAPIDETGGALAFPLYRGRDGATAFAIRLVRDAGVMVLPSSLWRSALAETQDDRLRIGLGQTAAAAALDALDAYLVRRPAGQVSRRTAEETISPAATISPVTKPPTWAIQSTFGARL